MHPILLRFERVTAYIGAWIVVAVVVALVLTRLDIAFTAAAIVVAPTFVAYGFVCLSGLYVCRAVPATTTGRLTSVIAAAALSAIAGGTMWLALFSAWRGLLSVVVPDSTGASLIAASRPTLDAQVPFLLTMAVTLYLLTLAAHHVAIAAAQARDAEHQRLEFQVLTRDAELRALRAQLNPHFLYNSLNSISALTSVDPGGARRMCLMLADFLRRTLRVSALDRIPLSEELSLVDAFIEIEQVRYGSRMTVERAIDESALACQVPPLLLQPLLENAVGHGIAGLVDGGVIRVQVAREADRLLIRVDNPRDPDVAPRRHGGVGLENVRRRAQTAYGDRARVDAIADGPRFRVDVNLPALEES